MTWVGGGGDLFGAARFLQTVVCQWSLAHCVAGLHVPFVVFLTAAWVVADLDFLYFNIAVRLAAVILFWNQFSLFFIALPKASIAELRKVPRMKVHWPLALDVGQSSRAFVDCVAELLMQLRDGRLRSVDTRLFL